MRRRLREEDLDLGIVDRAEMGLRYRRLRGELRAFAGETDSPHYRAIHAEFLQLGRAIDAEDRRRRSLSNLSGMPLRAFGRE